MKTLKLIGLFLLASCGNQSIESATAFRHILPDTVKTWAGQMTRDDYYSTRSLEKKLHLETLTNGVNTEELRIWRLSGSYDPQVLFILKKMGANEWHLRTLSFYQSKGDSIYADYTRLLRSGSVDSLKLGQYWSVASQSDLKAGDSYGCIDSENVFVELADSTKYRFMWYRCPDINKDKDSAFFLVSKLRDRLDGLAAEH
jgi:hypothetical protein